MIRLHRLTAVLVLPLLGACAGGVYLPGQPGAADNDLSGLAVREQWLAANPQTPDDISEAILEGVFIEGMTIEHRDIITNPDRRGATGSGYWRSRNLVEEVRYQWYVAAERQPFDDGRGRAVCELVYRDDLLSDVRYCQGVEDLDGG
jgi:hypothetical protein